MKKGFTLIELLAVIIILAVIALIATPVVLNVVEEAKIKADRNSVYGLVDAAKLYYAESLLDTDKKAYTNGTTNVLDKLVISGEGPESGEIYINDKGQSAIAVVYDKVCFTKNFNEFELSESDDIENCELGIEEVYIPVKPNIIVSDYNILHKDGISRLKIDFDTKEGVVNYYSVDNGETWIECSNFISNIESDKILAKSTYGEYMSEISEASIPALKTNALSTNAWNENEKSVNFSSSSSSTNGRIVNIDKNLVGKTLNIRVGQSGSSYCWNAVVLYDENDIEIDRVETACNGTKEKNIIITEQMKKIHFSSQGNGWSKTIIK